MKMIENITNQKLKALLGMTLKAGILIKGQDSIRRELRKGSRLLILLAADHSKNVASMIEGYRQRGHCTVIVLDNLTRSEFEETFSLGRTQILGLPEKHGLTSKILDLVTEEVVANEQDKNL